MSDSTHLKLKKLDIDTYNEAVIYLHTHNPVCSSEGFDVHARLNVYLEDRTIIATLHIVHSDILKDDEAGLSSYAWRLLNAKEGSRVQVSHAAPPNSLESMQVKLNGGNLSKEGFKMIVEDITAGRYSDIYISSFLTACSLGNMSMDEVLYLTEAMVDVGDQLNWPSDIVVDKHCVGGLPGNRTTPIIVAIVAAFGLVMPKSSSRAITSPSGTADTMEVLAPVKLSLEKMQAVVNEHNGCVVWGGAATLSPADDILISVERALNLDSMAQLVASVLSKKVAAGSTHVLIDIPIGDTVKVRTLEQAEYLKECFCSVAKNLDLSVKVIFSDGKQPVGHGIGPALEARDVIAVLRRDDDAPQDLVSKAIHLAAYILEFSESVDVGEGESIAKEVLESGAAWETFQRICESQGGMKEIPLAKHTHTYIAQDTGVVSRIDNSRLALLAKLAGAPVDKTAGIDMHVRLNQKVKKGEPIFTIHSESLGELEYASNYLYEKEGNVVVNITDD